MRRLAHLWPLLALLLWPLTHHANAGDSDGVLRRGNGPDIETLDPAQARSVSAGNVLRDLFEGLVTEAPDGQLVGGAAQRWEVSDDGLRYTFFLRGGLRWSNGEALAAEDFVYSLRRALDPATASPSAQLLAPIAQLGAPDAHTLQITLHAPTPYLPALLANPVAYPVHRASVERLGAAFTRPGKLVSNGAYRLQDQVLQSHVDLQRNADYWNDAATRIARVRHIVTEDAGSEFQRFRAGELDVTEQVPSAQIAGLSPALRRRLHVADYLGVYYYGFNLSQPPFDRAELRRALSLAIDREVIVRKLLGSGEHAAHGWLPPQIGGGTTAQPPSMNWTREQRLSEARRLYAQAGYSAQHPLHTEILYNTSEVHQKIAVVVSAMWKQFLGVQTTLRVEETKVFLQSRRMRRRTQIFRGSWVSDYDDASSFLDLLMSTNPRNDTGYASARYDGLLADAASRSGDARSAVLAQAQAQMLDDAPVIPIYFYVTKHLVAARVRGWRDNPLDHHYSRDLAVD